MADLIEAFFNEFPPGALAIWLGILTWAGWKMWAQLDATKRKQALLEQAHGNLVERLNRGFKRNDDRHGFMEELIGTVGKQVLEVGTKVGELTGAVDKMNGGSR